MTDHFRLRILLGLFLISFSMEASIIDDFWGLVESAKIKLGLVEAAPVIELPQIPEDRKNPLDTSIYSQKKNQLYPANLELKKWSREKKKKVDIGYLMELYTKVQVRVPLKDEFKKWYSILEQGSSREGLYRALVLGRKYRKLETLDEMTNGKANDFTEKFLKKFLKKKAKPELLRRLNAYQLKKFVVEMSLNTLEQLQIKPEDLFRWYAVFSGDLAEGFPSIWDYELRANPDRKTHYAWAKKTPLQHIKSEVILKLHHVYNHLLKLKK